MKPIHIVLSQGVGHTLINAAIQGYEAAYKQERLGILFGQIQANTAVVEYAQLYRGGDRTRSEANVNPNQFTRRVRTLSQEYGSEFLGTFHTHNEIAGKISSAMSVEDRTHLCLEPPHIVEIIVAIWQSDAPSRQSQQYLQVDTNGYRLRFAGYQMCSPFRLIPVTWLGAD